MYYTNNGTVTVFCHFQLFFIDDWKPSSSGRVVVESSCLRPVEFWFKWVILKFQPPSSQGVGKSSHVSLRSSPCRTLFWDSIAEGTSLWSGETKPLAVSPPQKNTVDSFVSERMLSRSHLLLKSTYGSLKMELHLLCRLNDMALETSFFARSGALLNLQCLFRVFENRQLFLSRLLIRKQNQSLSNSWWAWGIIFSCENQLTRTLFTYTFWLLGTQGSCLSVWEKRPVPGRSHRKCPVFWGQVQPMQKSLGLLTQGDLTHGSQILNLKDFARKSKFLASFELAKGGAW